MSSSRKAYPYFKIQTYDARSLTWVEYRRAFDSLEEARSLIQQEFSENTTRIVRVDQMGYHPIGEGE